MSPTVLHIGPSLEAREARERTDASILPPIRRGDMPNHVTRGVRRVLIVDGEFRQSLAVSVAEIRAAIRAGVEVWGASSMGALRAAECHVLGMRGVGWIYHAYRERRLEADDEVALLFDAETLRPITVPLVNVRWTADVAAATGRVTTDEAVAVVDAAASVAYDMRTWSSVVRAAADRGCASAAAYLASLAETDPGGCDRKRLDALELLDALMTMEERA